MLGPDDHDRIPETVPPLPLPEFDYDDIEKGDRIGTGGDADVYRATVNYSGYTYPVAVKQPRFEGTIQKRVIERFQTEAETWSGLSDHDNIVSVYAWGIEPLPWLALEFMDGGTLNAQIGSLNVAEALWLAGRISEGIRYGHRHGVAHLDIKPTNVLLRDTGEGTWDYPKVSDWGLAKMLLEHSNSIEGISPTYAAPEQFDAEEYGSPDDITDIYQLGALVYAMVVGEPPFSGSSTAIMRGVLQEDPQAPSEINSDVPSAVDDIVLKALAKRKEDRYDGLVTFRNELDRLFEEYIVDGTSNTSTTVLQGASEPKDWARDERADSEENISTADSIETVDSEHPTQSASDENRIERPSSQSTDQSSTDGDNSSFVSRRSALGVLGIGIIGGGGWLAATQMGEDVDSSAPAMALTDTPTATRSESSSQRAPETSTETRMQTEASATSGNAAFEESFEDGNTSGWTPIAELNSTFEASGERAFSGSFSAKFSEGNQQDNPKWQRVGEMARPNRVETAHALENGEVYSDSNTKWLNDDTVALRVNYDWSRDTLLINGSNEADLPWPSSEDFFHVVLNNINWDNNVVGEVRVNGTVQAENLPFMERASGIDRAIVSIGGAGGNVIFIDDTTIPTG